MRLLLVGLTLGLGAILATAQQPARIGPDGKPLLNRPILEECKKSENTLFIELTVVAKFGHLCVTDFPLYEYPVVSCRVLYFPKIV